METAIILITIFAFGIVVSSFKESKLLLKIVITVVFLGTIITLLGAHGITVQSLESIGFVGFALLIVWLRFNKMFEGREKTRAWLENKFEQKKIFYM